VQQPKIFLRFTRPGPTEPANQTQGGLYPALPVSELFSAEAGRPAGRENPSAYAYREASAGLSTESEGEYVSARSEASSS
jgi:hypothetical protein